jgi:hypothetical protein
MCIFNNTTATADRVLIGLIEDEAAMVASSGTFGVYIRKLRRMGLIEYKGKEFWLSKNFDRFLKQ